MLECKMHFIYDTNGEGIKKSKTLFTVISDHVSIINNIL